MDKILFCHHLEQMWNNGLKQHGTSIYEMCDKVLRYLQENKEVSEIYISRFDFDHREPFDECHYELLEYANEHGIKITCLGYGYGWTLDNFNFEDVDLAQEKIDAGEVISDEYGTKIAKGGIHSDVVIIEDWMESLRNKAIILCGAFYGECLDDIQTAFDAINLDYKLEFSLIV